MKKPVYEQSLITELMEHMALGNPSVAFRLTSQGKTILKTFGSGDALQAAGQIYGSAWAEGLKRVSESEGAFAINGFIGVGDQAQPTRSRQCFFINGRLVSCRALSQALEEVCRGRVTIGKYPSCALNVTLPTRAVDVNAHPGKLEVRFRDEAAFRLTAQTLLQRVFATERMMDAAVPQMELPETQKQVSVLPVNEPPANEKADDAFAYLRSLDIPQAEKPAVDELHEAAPAIKPLPRQEKTDVVTEAVPRAEHAEQTRLETMASDTPAFRLIGVYLNTYILLEYRQSLIMIDQHAAHERLNYERYVKALDEGAASQRLLLPFVMELSAREESTVAENLDILRECGYEVELFGSGALRVMAVPFLYGQSDMRLLFTEMLDDLRLLKKAERERRLASVIQASCKHAVKAGDRLSDAEIGTLLELMNASDAPPTCPHGRPILKVFSKRNVEQMFKRIQ